MAGVRKYPGAPIPDEEIDAAFAAIPKNGNKPTPAIPGMSASGSELRRNVNNGLNALGGMGVVANVPLKAEQGMRVMINGRQLPGPVAAGGNLGYSAASNAPRVGGSGGAVVPTGANAMVHSGPASATQTLAQATGGTNKALQEGAMANRNAAFVRSAGNFNAAKNSVQNDAASADAANLRTATKGPDENNSSETLYDQMGNVIGTVPKTDPSAISGPPKDPANKTAEYAKRLGMNSLNTPSAAGAGRGLGPDAELRNRSRDMTAELSGRPNGRLPQLPSDLREGVVHKTIDPKTGAVTYSGRNVGTDANGQTQFVNGKGETIQPRGSVDYAAAGTPVGMTGAGGGGIAFTPSSKVGAGAQQQQSAQADQTPSTGAQQPSGPTPSSASANGMSPEMTSMASNPGVSAALRAAAERGDMDAVRGFYQQNGGSFNGRTAAQDQAEEQTKRDNAQREWANNALRNSYDPRYDRGAGAEARINAEKAGAEKVLKDLNAKTKAATDSKLADAQMAHYKAQEANANAQLGMNGLRAQIEMAKYNAEQGEKRAQTADKTIDDYFKIPKMNDKGQVIGFENNDVARNEFQKRMAEKGVDPTKMSRAELQRTMRDFGMVSDMNRAFNQKVANERGSSGVTQDELQDPSSYTQRGMRFSDIWAGGNAVSAGDWASGLFRGSGDVSNQVMVDKFGQIVPAESVLRRPDGTLNADLVKMYEAQKAKKAQ